MILLSSFLLAIISVGNCLPQDNEASMEGNSTSNRIVGGTIAPPEYQGYQVALLLAVSMAPKFHCGGSIISSSHVLTAAHCIDFLRPSSYRTSNPTLFGRIGSPTWHSGGKIINFKSHRVHPRWNRKFLKYDIGILFVQNTIQFTDKIKLVALGFERVTDGDNVDVTGWGDTGEQKASSVLKLLHLKVIGYKQCSSIMKGAVVDAIEICGFSSVGNSVCYGDSGGALLKGGKQVGIVSWGTPPCASEAPDVFARISGLQDFITSIVGNEIIVNSK